MGGLLTPLRLLCRSTVCHSGLLWWMVEEVHVGLVQRLRLHPTVPLKGTILLNTSRLTS